MAQLASSRELLGVLTAGQVGRAAGAAVPCPGPQQVCLAMARDADAAAARDAATAAARDSAAAAERAAATAIAADEAAAAGDDPAQAIAEALSRRVALGSWTAPPSRSELRWRVCGRRQGGVRGVCPDSPLLPVWSFKCPSSTLIVPFCPSGPSSALFPICALPVPFQCLSSALIVPF
ncbi:unnamed protein product [Boreogadus saida]